MNIEKPKDIPIASSVIDLRNTFLNIEGVEQDDINMFFGLDKELNRSFSLMIEYDAALNDNDYIFNDISFGKGIGYLNAGIRWAVSPNLMMEINFNDISKNTDAEYMTDAIPNKRAIT